MATRRRIGVSAATTEAARRQLMQPVPCWEKVWITPESLPTGSTLKVFKWTKTEKLQQFSDDEGEVDEPLVPLPDEPEVVEGDEEMDQDETVLVAPEVVQADVVDLATAQDDIQSKPPSPKPQLSMTLQPSSEVSVERPDDGLDASLNPIDTNIDVDVGIGEKTTLTDGIELDMSGLGPDGLALESSENLSQMEGTDALVGGPMMDHSADPFAEAVNE